MDQDIIKNYTVRITQANRSELIVILYELAMLDIKEALETMSSKAIDHACKCVNELVVSLDFSYEISFELLRLYRYVNECLLRAKTAKDKKLMEQALETLEALHIAFEGVAKQDMSAPVMQNTEQVYAGLTYSKGVLNEALLHPSGERGFRA